MQPSDVPICYITRNWHAKPPSLFISLLLRFMAKMATESLRIIGVKLGKICELRLTESDVCYISANESSYVK